jgi:plastocyanin
VKKTTAITVANVGSTAHTFTVTDQNIDIENQQGQSQQVTIDLAPGTYPFICRFHVSEGMTGTLVVQG